MKTKRPDDATPRPPTPPVCGISLRCTYCHDALAGSTAVFCGSCLAPHHAECVATHRGCSAPGCRSRAIVRPAQPGHWHSLRRYAVIGLLLFTHGLTALGVGAYERARPPSPSRDTIDGRHDFVTAQVARLTHLTTSLENDIADLRQSFIEQREALKEGDTVLAMLADHGIDTSYVIGPPVPAIDAKVSAVKSDVSPELVLLSVGSDDKVEKGFHFSVYRGQDFVGKVIVEKVLRDSCGCRVLFTKEGASVQPGDSAATRLQ